MHMTSPSQPSLLLRTSTLIPLTIVSLTIGWARHDQDRERRGTLLSFLHAGRERTAVLVTPEGAAPTAGWPVVLLLHGAGGSGSQIVLVEGWRRCRELRREGTRAWLVVARRRPVARAPDRATPRDDECDGHDVGVLCGASAPRNPLSDARREHGRRVARFAWVH